MENVYFGVEIVEIHAYFKNRYFYEFLEELLFILVENILKLNFFSFKIYEDTLKEEGNRGEREICYLLIHSSSDCNSWGWSSLKLKAWNPIWVSHVGGKNQST